MPHINRALRIFLASAGALALAACAEQATSPDAGPSRLGDGIRPPMADAVTFWEAGAAVRWNGIARGLTLVHQQSPFAGQRIYAYLNLAVYDAAVAVEDAPGHPSPQAAAGAAAVHDGETDAAAKPIMPRVRTKRLVNMMQISRRHARAHIATKDTAGIAVLLQE